MSVAELTEIQKVFLMYLFSFFYAALFGYVGLYIFFKINSKIKNSFGLILAGILEVTITFFAFTIPNSTVFNYLAINIAAYSSYQKYFFLLFGQAISLAGVIVGLKLVYAKLARTSHVELF